MAAAPVNAQDVAQGGLPPEEAQLLADILKDDSKRAVLIQQLERAGGDSETGAAPAETATPSIGARVAEITSRGAGDIARGAVSLRDQILAAPAAFSRLSIQEVDQLLRALQNLALVIVVTTGVLIAIRAWLRRFYRRLGAREHDISIGRTLMIVMGIMVLDALAVLAAAACGYLAALIFTGTGGDVGVRQAMYLNAFMLVGLIKVAIRAVLSPATPAFRLISFPNRGARMMSRWFGAILGVLGYGQLLITPIAARQISPEAGAAVSTILALLAILIAVALTIRGRRGVARWLAGETDRRGFSSFLIANWHLPVLVYLAGLFIVVATRPDGVFWPMLIRSAQVLGAVIVGGIASAAISRSIAQGVTVPAGVRARLPLLERRLNRFVPRVLWLARTVIVAAVIGFAVDAAGLFDTSDWLENGAGGPLAATLFSVFMIGVVAFVLWVALASWVDFRLNPEFGAQATSREKTLLSLFRNAATVVVIVLAAMFSLSEMGVNIAPLIASAGVFGLAIGFGAQKMVQDIITGVFIQFENAMNVGDVVTLNGVTGMVERLTVRSVSLRDVEGCFHIIPFSSVDMVSNFMREYGNFVCDMGIAYREDISEAKLAMHDAFDELKTDPKFGPDILEPLQWFGLQTLGDSAVVVRARIKCAPGKQWNVGRAYNEIVKRVFDERGIEIPFPHQTIYFGVDKKGEAPPLHVATDKIVAPS